MLQNLRDNSKGVISGILIGLLVIIFAVSGAEALFKWDANSAKAVKVNGEAISDTEIARAIANRKQRILSQYGESVPAEYLTDEKLREPTINELVKLSLLSQAAKKGGLAANTNALNEEIARSPAFQNNGAFDQARYLQLLRYQGYTPGTYQKALAEEAMINQLQSGVSRTGFVTAAELQNILGLHYQTRDFSYVMLPVEKAQKAVTVEEQDIKAHYDANPQAYTTPEQVAVDYVELSVAELAKNIPVSDEQIQKQFEQNTKAFNAKTERQAAHILLEGDAQKTADEIKAKLAAGEDFAKLAKQYSTDAGSKEQGGDLGFSSGDAFPAEFEAALAKLKVGEVSEPVKTEAGTHIIKLVSERASKAPTLEEAKDDIVEQLKRAEAESQFSTKLDKLKDLAYNADKLEQVANELGLKVHNTGLFAKTGGKDLTANSSFVVAAFSPEVLEQGNASDVIELEQNRVVVLKKTDRKPAQLQPLESVKAQITETVRAEKTQALLARQAKEFVDAINSGKAIADLAKAAGVEVKTAAAVGRTDRTIDTDVLQYVFSLAAPAEGKQANGSVKTMKGDYAVVSLSGVHLGDLSKIPEEQRKAIATQLASISGDYDFKAYQAHLEEVSKIKRPK